MTDKEKAKAYDEAIERGKQIQTTPYTAHWDIMKEVAEHLLPELKEGESERIRKELRQYLEECINLPNGQYCKADFFAWIDKQGEKKPNYCHHEVDLSGCSEEYRKAYYDGWNNCNQQHEQLKAEQKPWSEEDEKDLFDAAEHLRNFADNFVQGEYSKTGILGLADRIETFRPQTTWKPSEEMLEALNDINITGCISYAGQGQELISLYNELKRLREE